MGRLFIRTPEDEPHARNEDFPQSSVCGRSLVGAQEITEQQALKYLGDRRCTWCFPGWTTRKGHTHG